MPWTPEEFKNRHAKHLSPEQAAHGSAVANAMLKRGVPEGEAIATGISRGEGRKPAGAPKKGLQNLVHNSKSNS